MPIRRNFLAPLLLIALVCAIYLPPLFQSGGAAMLFDDPATLHSLGSRTLETTWTFSAPASNGTSTLATPSTASLFHLEFLLWGTNSAGYHLTSILLHAASTLLLYQLLRRLRMPQIAAAFAAALWAAHPIHVEAVAWISQQGIVLGFFFALCAGHAWLTWSKPPSDATPPSNAACIAAVVAAILAIASAPIFLALPLALPLLSFLHNGRIRPREIFFALPPSAASAFAIYLIAHEKAAAMSSIPAPPDALDYLRRAGESLGFYAGRILAPLHLALVYPPPDYPAAAALTLTAIFILLAILLFAQRKSLGRGGIFAALMFLIALAPSFVLASHNAWLPVGDRFSYLAALPLLAGLVAAAHLLWQRRAGLQRPLIAAAALFLLLFAALSLQRASAFAQPETLYRQTLAENPKAAIVSESLATLLLERHGIAAQAEALTLYQSAIQLMPTRSVAALASARILVAQGNSKDAQDILQKCLAANPDDPDANQMLADLVVQSIGELAYPIIEKNYERAFHVAPQNTTAALALAKIYLKEQHINDARRVLEKALLFNPSSVDLHLQLASVLTLLGDFRNAGNQYNVGTVLDPKNAQALCDWGIMQIAAGQPRDAEETLRKALALDPDNPKFHLHLGRALRDENQQRAAFQEFKIASDLDPHYAPPLYEMAQSYLIANDELHCEQALELALKADPSYIDAQIALARIWLNAGDPSLRNPDNALLLLRQAVSNTHEQDLSLMVAYADALTREKQFAEASDVYDRCIDLARKINLIPAQAELIYINRGRVQMKLLPPVPHIDTPYNDLGMEDPTDRPISIPPEHTVEDTMTDPMITANPGTHPMDPATVLHFPAEMLPAFNNFSPTPSTSPINPTSTTGPNQ